MTRKLFGLFAFVAALFLVACADDDSGEVIARVSESGTQYSPSSIKVSMDYSSPRIVVYEVKLVRLDGDYNPVDTIPMKDDDYYSSSMWKTDTTEFYSSYVKILVNGKGEDQKTSATLEYYLDLVETLDSANAGYSYYKDQWPQLTYAKALASERVKYLITEKDVPLAEAIKKSYSEIDTALKDFGNSQSFALQQLCRSTYFDSLYRHDFEDLKHVFTKKIEVPDSIRVRAADFQLSRNSSVVTENCIWSNMCGVTQADEYMRKTFQLDSCREVGVIDTIRNTFSVYVGEPVGCAKHSFGNYWRLLTDMEKVMGLCTGNRKVVYEGKLYRCSMLGSLWEEFDNPSMYNYLMENARVEEIYGKCNSPEAHPNAARYFNDELYVCKWEGNLLDPLGYIWSKGSPEGNNWIKADDALVDAAIARDSMTCTLGREGEKLIYDGKFYTCRDQAWRVISHIEYLIGVCDSSSVGKKGVVPDSSDVMFLVCDGEFWISVAAWEYYGETCEESSYYEVREHDGVSFWCNEKGFESVDAENRVPPTYDKKPCFGNDSEHHNEILEYDGKYYTCSKYGWRKSTDKELTAPVLNGNFCVAGKNLYEVVEADGKYYMCNYNNVWGEVVKKKYDQYILETTYKDYCNKGVAGTTLIWSDALESLAGCRKYYAGDKTEFGSFTMAYGKASPLYAGGTFVNDTLYRVKIDDLTYEFGITSGANWFQYIHPLKVYEGSVDEAGYKYDFANEDGAVFLHAKRGDDEVALSEIEGKSESFDKFYADWLKRVPEDHVSKGRLMKEAKTTKVDAIWYNKDSFMDYATAVAFCPEGFHIPDTTEWNSTAKLTMHTSSHDYRNDSPIREYSEMDPPVLNYSIAFTHLYDFFWTSSVKDENTQYCLEIVWDYFENVIARRFVECPKDLYPMVQAECVKD